MPQESYVEASFLIPIRGDKALGDGDLHATDMWNRLENELFVRFEGYTWAPGLHMGAYRDPDTKERVRDESRKCTVALPKRRVGELREMLALAAILFHQKCIYLAVAGKVELIEAPHEIDIEELSRFGRP